MDFDAIIIGAGLVGASFARAASGLSMALVGSASRSRVSEAFDARVYALSPGNVQFLRRLKVWQSIAPERLTPVYGMRVSADNGRSLLEFDAYRCGVEALAWIVEDGLLQDALWNSVRARDGIESIVPADCKELELAADHAAVRLGDGRALRASLVVGARLPI